MTDEQWLRAIKKYQSEFPTHSADALLKGGAVELSRELGSRAKEDPDRFGARPKRCVNGETAYLSIG